VPDSNISSRNPAKLKDNQDDSSWQEPGSRGSPRPPRNHRGV